MAITSELIGKLGGTDVEITPLNGSLDGPAGNEFAHTVTIPDGETYIVGIEGVVVPGIRATNSSPEIFIGDFFVSDPIVERPNPINFFQHIQGPATFDVGIRRRANYNPEEITSDVYAVPLP